MELKDRVMDLALARETAAGIREWGDDKTIHSWGTALVILDDRITELEKQAEEQDERIKLAFSGGV